MLTNTWYPAGTEMSGHRRTGLIGEKRCMVKSVIPNFTSQLLYGNQKLKERKENLKRKFPQVSQHFKPGHRDSVLFLGLCPSFTSCVEIHWNSQTGPGVPGAALWVTSQPCSDGFPLSSWAREVPPVLQKKRGGKGNERDGNRGAKRGQPGDGRVSASPVAQHNLGEVKMRKNILKKEKQLIGVWAEAWGVLWCVRAVLGSGSKYLGLNAAIPEHLWCWRSSLHSRTTCAVKSSLEVLLGATILLLQKTKEPLQIQLIKKKTKN